MKACDELKKRGMRFIGVVNTAIRGLCMEKLSEIELAHSGLWKGYFSLDDNTKLDKFAFVWVDRDWGYFIYNTPSLKHGVPYAMDRLIHVNDSPNADQVCVEFEFNQPRVDERYYPSNPNIDESNQTRQDYSQLERNLQTNDWSIRVNTSILGM